MTDAHIGNALPSDPEVERRARALFKDSLPNCDPDKSFVDVRESGGARVRHLPGWTAFIDMAVEDMLTHP